MSVPTATDHADDTKLYDGGKDSPHAVPNVKKDAGHEGPHKDLKPMPTGVVLLFVGGLVLLLAVMFVLGYIPRHQRRVQAEKEVQEVGNALPVVGVANPKPPTASPTLEVPGDAQAYQVTSLFARTNGYLKRRLVDIGDKVTEGQLLAEIDTPEVTAQLAASRATLLQSEAAASKAKDDFTLAEATYERYENFAKNGGVTQQQLDERRSALTSAKATLAGADANVKVGEAEVQRLTSLVGFTQITAPFTGTITTRGYDVGALLSADNSSGRELFQIARVDTLRVFVDIPQSYATFVKTGQPVKFTVSNYPGRPFDGYIARASGAINQASRTMRIEADFPNNEGLLFPGMYGTLRYEANQDRGQLLIASSALIFGPEGMRVGVIDSGDRVRFKPVTLGADLGTEVEITNGLDKADRVVLNPGERLVDGLQVAVSTNKPPAGNGGSPTTPATPNQNQPAQPKSETAQR